MEMLRNLLPKNLSRAADAGGFVRIMLGIVGISGLFGACDGVAAVENQATVALLKTPGGGIQPQAVLDHSGIVHLIYYQGNANAGDLHYVRQRPGETGWSAPIKINSRPKSAVALATVHGAQLAVGKGGRVHVVWCGPNAPREQRPGRYAELFYARSNVQGTSFEPQRNLMQSTFGLVGGGSVAADAAGRVYVAWHGYDKPGHDESARRMWVARSDDEGESFSRESPATAEQTGACSCCSVKAFADSRGTSYVLYRAATANVNRDMVLLVSRDHGRTFLASRVHSWKISYCPMTSEALTEGPAGPIGAWETEGQVYFATIDPTTGVMSAPIPGPGESKDRKHPAVATNAARETILVWTEGTGWQRGGALAWQVFDKSGRPTKVKGRIPDGIPAWGLATVVARPDGSFLIVH